MFIATFRIVFSSIQRLNVSVALVVIHTYYCFGQIMLMSDRTIMGVQTLSEDTIHPAEHYYWSVFIVNNYIPDPAYCKLLHETLVYSVK